MKNNLNKLGKINDDIFQNSNSTLTIQIFEKLKNMTEADLLKNGITSISLISEKNLNPTLVVKMSNNKIYSFKDDNNILSKIDEIISK